MIRRPYRILPDLDNQHGLGEVVPGPLTVHLHDELVLEPDVVFVARDRLHIVDPEGAIHGRVTEHWLVDADERTVEIWRAGEGDAQTVGDWIGWMVGERGYRVMLDDVFRG